MRQGALTRAVRDSSQPVRESQANGNRRPNAAQTMPEHEPAGTSTLEIANAIVRSYKEILGRGLTKTRVLFAGADTLVVVLEDTMTVQDRNVAALGEHERLREQRLFLTTAAEDQWRASTSSIGEVVQWVPEPSVSSGGRSMTPTWDTA
jgi:uncharacterized protein YbcI